MENEEIAIKQHTILSQAIQLITNEYPEKFWTAETIRGMFIKENAIMIIGDLDILKTEAYEKVIDFRGEKESYTIILKPLSIIQLTPTTY